MRRIKILLFFFCSVIVFDSYAAVKLPAIVSSNMVLQRNTEVTIWGWADADEKLTINASWLGYPVSTVANAKGNWSINVVTTNSKEPQTISIKSADSDIQLENVLFGEVWLCSGQSNMEMPVKGFTGQPVLGAQQAIVHARNENLRLFTVERQASLEPNAEVQAYRGWQSANSDNVSAFSAVAYFFGQQLQEILDVPVGIIHTSWGGSLIEAWMSAEALGSVKKFDLNGVDLNRGNRFPTVLFNAMINPLIPYTIKGALWYQGEANAGRPDEYRFLFPAMVKDWRDRWKIGDFPFYFVQIAPFMYSKENRIDDKMNSAFMREAQLNCVDMIPNSGIAVTTDIGDDVLIHPPDKKKVADRLLYNALNQTYGIKAVDYAGPVYESMEIKDGGIYLSFKNADQGLFPFMELDGFEIAGADKVFYPAEASVYGGRQVFVKGEEVKNPVAVRYGWRNWTKGTLFDTFMLPASSFRTDNWEDATQAD